MKKTIEIFLLIFVLSMVFAVVYPATNAYAKEQGARPQPGSQSGYKEKLQQTPEGDKLVMGGSYVLEEGETLNGSLFILGGAAQIMTGSHVLGDIAIVGGSLNIDGAVGGDVVAIGGYLSLGAKSHVKGDINTVSAQLDRSEGAIVDGAINTVATGTGPFSIILPKNFHLPRIDTSSMTLPRDLGVNRAFKALLMLIRSLVWAALAVLLALFIPKPLERIAGAATGAVAAAGGMGCLTILIVPLLLILIAITICGIPITLIGFLMLFIAWGLGVISLGVETGRRLASLFKIEWALPVSAAFGVFILTLVANGAELLVPCLGWVVSVLIGVIGLGAALLTRFGTQDYFPEKTFETNQISPSVPTVIETPGLDESPSGEEDLPDQPA